jgi:TonB family protein
MKYTQKLTVIVMFGSAFVFAQAPSSTEKKSENPAGVTQATIKDTAGDHAAAVDMGGGLEVLSDTQGFDFGPYLQRVKHDVKQNWQYLIPEAAKPPLLKKGKVTLEFAILKNGQIAGLRYVIGSGDVAFDRAAYGGITSSTPFPALPFTFEFTGQYLSLRMTFLYNPWLTAIEPSGAQVPAGFSLQFSAVLKGKTQRTGSRITWITWSVGGRTCAESACGTISDSGLYTAPLKVPDDPTITVKATAKGDLGEMVSAIVTIVPD